jgi:hypothetical protein
MAAVAEFRGIPGIGAIPHKNVIYVQVAGATGSGAS